MSERANLELRKLLNNAGGEGAPLRAVLFCEMVKAARKLGTADRPVKVRPAMRDLPADEKGQVVVFLKIREFLAKLRLVKNDHHLCLSTMFFTTSAKPLKLFCTGIERSSNGNRGPFTCSQNSNRYSTSKYISFVNKSILSKVSP